MTEESQSMAPCAYRRMLKAIWVHLLNSWGYKNLDCQELGADLILLQLIITTDLTDLSNKLMLKFLH